MITKPYELRHQNNLEIINETFVLISCYCYLPFTEAFNPSFALKKQIGYYSIALTLLFFMMNMFYFFVLKIFGIIAYMKRKFSKSSSKVNGTLISVKAKS